MLNHIKYGVGGGWGGGWGGCVCILCTFCTPEDGAPALSCQIIMPQKQFKPQRKNDIYIMMVTPLVGRLRPDQKSVIRIWISSLGFGVQIRGLNPKFRIWMSKSRIWTSKSRI